MTAPDVCVWEDNRPSITALREALAQPDHIANAGKVIEPSDYDREFWGDGQPQGEWVDLTDEEIWNCKKPLYRAFAREVIAKFKEKNTPVVQQDHSGEATDMVQEPVAWMDNDGNVCDHNEFDCFNIPLYTTPPTAPNLNCKSVQRRLATSWGYVRKEEYDMAKVAAARQMRDAAVKAWDEGYESGINDERTSEANIGIAGFGAKVVPNRQNPYAALPIIGEGK